MTGIIGDARDATYLGCPTCFSKVKDAFCDKCKIKLHNNGERFYFFRAYFEDCTGMIQVALSRQPALDIMQTSAKKYHNLEDPAAYLKENVFFREMKLQTKVKEEQFKGELATRYYVQEAKFVEDAVSENRDLIE